MRAAVETLLELLYPRRCAFCRRLTGGEGVCAACRKELPAVRGEALEQRFPYVERCLAPLYYEGAVRESLLRYKFGGLRAYGKIYSEILSKCVDGKEISCDIITWVPLSRKRLRRRGYDQARLLAEGLAEHLGLPCVRLLDKTRDTPPQSGVGGAEARRANAAGVYRAADPARTAGRRVLLVDDIVTTGATFSACAAVLRMAGAASVSAAALARRREEPRKTDDLRRERAHTID